MKRFFVLATALFFGMTVMAQAKTEEVVKFGVETHDFGKIKVNVPVSHEFRFTNSGDAPLVLSSVHASCGCTVTDYSKDPIAPGAEGYVKTTYNAAKVGVFTKTVTVTANAEESVVQLSIKGEVVE